MAVQRSSKPSRSQMIRQQFTRKQILESLMYELKPFVLSAAGIVSAVYFSQADNNMAKHFSVAITVCGLVILYSRAKQRGVIQ